MDLSNRELRMKILWHDVWIDGGPVFGVGEVNGEIIFYNRHTNPELPSRDFVFNLHRFKNEESKRLALEAHEEYRSQFGGHQDHQVEKFTPAALIGKADWRSFFDYYSHIEADFFATIKKENIDCFYPPNKYNQTLSSSVTPSAETPK